MQKLKVPREIEAYYEAFFAADMEGILACFTPDAEVRSTGLEHPARGPAQIRAYFEAMLDLSRDMKAHRHRFLVLPQAVTATSEITMPLPGRGPTPYLFTSIQVYELDEAGLIFRLLTFTDLDGAVPMG
jgi:SnoaL-like domain